MAANPKEILSRDDCLLLLFPLFGSLWMFLDLSRHGIISAVSYLRTRITWQVIGCHQKFFLVTVVSMFLSCFSGWLIPIICSCCILGMTAPISTYFSAYCN